MAAIRHATIFCLLVSFLQLALSASKNLLAPSQAIKCYQCGLYVDGGSVTPCMEMGKENMKDCKPSDNFCVKYVVKGGEVRQCADKCNESSTSSLSVYCCQNGEGCNGAWTNSAPHSLLLLSALLSIRRFF